MNRNFLWVLLGFVIFAAVRTLLAYFGPGYLIDDAYITLRYVDNFTDTGSFSYHANDRIFGISTMLYPCVLALLKMFLPHVGAPVDLVVIDMGLNIFLEYACVVVLVWFFRRLDISLLISSGLALVVVWHPLLLSSSQGGMETPLFVLWILLTMAFVDKSMMLAAAFAGMALLTRPEGSIIMGMVGLLTLFREGRFSIDLSRNLPIYTLLFGFVLTYLSFYVVGYGTLYPSSVEIKHLIRPEDPLHAFLYFLKAPALLIPLGSIPWPVRSLVVCAGVVYGLLRWPRRDFAQIFILGVCLLNFLLYSIANPPMWFWYPAPMVTLLGVIFYYGLYQLVAGRTVVVIVALLVLVGLEVRWVYFTKGTLLDTYTHRVSKYHDIIAKLKTETSLTPQQSILTHEIGAIGYFSKSHIVDAVGLINPSLAHLGVVSKSTPGLPYGRATAQLIEKTFPDYIIFQKKLFAPGVLDSEEFKKNYRFLFGVPHSAIDPESGDVEVYQRIKK